MRIYQVVFSANSTRSWITMRSEKNCSGRSTCSRLKKPKRIQTVSRAEARVVRMETNVNQLRKHEQMDRLCQTHVNPFSKIRLRHESLSRPGVARDTHIANLIQNQTPKTTTTEEI